MPGLSTVNTAAVEQRETESLLIARTLKFLAESPKSMAAFDHLQIQSNQRSEFQNALDEYGQLINKLKNIEDIDEEELKKLLNKKVLSSRKEDRMDEVRSARIGARMDYYNCRIHT